MAREFEGSVASAASAGRTTSHVATMVSTMNVRPAAMPLVEKICARAPWCSPEVLDALLELAIEIAREGREGRRIGTLFTLGRADDVLMQSRPLILDPLAGHAAETTHIFDRNVRGTVKELAQLDGAFIVSEDGHVRSACRYLDASVEHIDLPLGLGSRHLAAASISKTLKLVAIVVSESAVVRVFNSGELVGEIIPELWLFRRHMQSQMRGPVTEQRVDDLAILTAEEADPSTSNDEREATARIDEALEETFPASDPPASTPVTGARISAV
jgi:diadenylate cyclase